MQAASSRNLSYYLQQAEKNSPLIHKAVNDNQVVTLNLQQMKNVLKQPQVSLDASVLLSPIVSHDNGSTRVQLASNGADRYNGYDLAVTNGGQYQALLSVQQPLFTQKSYRNYDRQAAIDRQINDNSIRLTKHEIEQLVSRQYILCITSQLQLDISAEQMKELTEQLQVMHVLVSNAIYKQTDEMLLQLEYQTYKDAYASNRADYAANLYDLNALCGIHDTTVVDLEPTHFRMNNLPITQSQFITSYTLDSLAVIADRKINDLKYLPQVNLVANGGLNSSYLPTPNRLGISAGITFSWTLYDGHQRELQLKKSQYGLQNITFDKQLFSIQQNTNKDKIIRQIEALDEHLKNLNDQLTIYSGLISAYELQLSHGNISVMDYKNILKDATAKKQEIVTAQMEKEALISSYNYWNY
jgi:outer membrane protein TolC